MNNYHVTNLILQYWGKGIKLDLVYIVQLFSFLSLLFTQNDCQILLFVSSELFFLIH